MAIEREFKIRLPKVLEAEQYLSAQDVRAMPRVLLPEPNFISENRQLTLALLLQP